MALVAETGMVVHKGCVEKAKDMQGKLFCVIVRTMCECLINFIHDYNITSVFLFMCRAGFYTTVLRQIIGPMHIPSVCICCCCCVCVCMCG